MTHRRTGPPLGQRLLQCDGRRLDNRQTTGFGGCPVVLRTHFHPMSPTRPLVPSAADNGEGAAVATAHDVIHSAIGAENSIRVCSWPPTDAALHAASHVRISCDPHPATSVSSSSLQ